MKPRTSTLFTLAALLLASPASLHAAENPAVVTPAAGGGDGQNLCRASTYRGWKSLMSAGNGVELQSVPQSTQKAILQNWGMSCSNSA